MHKVFGAFLCILRVTFAYISQSATVFLGQWVVHTFWNEILMGFAPLCCHKCNLGA